jgi:hypothetical protein
MTTKNRPVKGIVWQNGSAVFLARAIGWDGVALHRSDVASISYTVFEKIADVWTPVTGHTAVSLTVNDVLSDTLETTDDRWTRDSIGYNFEHLLDTTVNQAFATAEAKYLVVYSVTPTGDPRVKIVFELDCRAA